MNAKSFGTRLLAKHPVLSSFLTALAAAVVFATSTNAALAAPGFETSEPALSSSAARPIGVPAELFIQRALSHQKARFPGSSSSVVGSKTSFDRANWSLVPTLPESELQSSFETVRDERPFHDEELRARRATWLYPDDGCFVRAVIADKILREKFTVAQSAKIYAFGNLRVKTKNSPHGSVEWWYHVAAIAKVQTPTGDEAFVYDPAMEPTQPLPVKVWLERMSDRKLEIAICSGASYDPHSECEAESNELASAVGRAHREANWYLPSEWNRVTELGRDPHQELLK